MAINAYVGLPGSGKSYSVVENVILPALKSGRNVMTNIPLNLNQIGADFDIENLFPISNDDLLKADGFFWLGIPGGTVIVLDEVWRLWPAGMKATDIKIYHKEFLAEHRHRVGQSGLTQEIILIVQDLSQIAGYVRLLVDTTYVAKKLDKVGAKTKYRIDVYSGGQKGPNYPHKTVLNTLYGKYKPDVFKYYISHTKSDTGLPGMELVVDDRANIWKNPFIRYGMPLMLIFVIFGVYRTLGFFSPKSLSPAAAPAAPPAPAPSPASLVVNSHPVISPDPSSSSNSSESSLKSPRLYSKVWRIIGSLTVGDSGKTYIIKNIVAGTMYVPASSCTYQYGDPTCVIDGETITKSTGRPTLQVFSDATQRVTSNAVNSLPETKANSHSDSSLSAGH
jgi:zona occludens toxin